MIAAGGTLIDEAAAIWLAEAEASLDPRTIKSYIGYVRAQWQPFFMRVAGLTPAAIDDYWRSRLRSVSRSTVLKELYALHGFLHHCVDTGQLDAMPAHRMPPRSATGRRSASARVEPVPLTEAEVLDILAELPELAAPRGQPQYRVRDRLAFAWETALRPATLDAIEAPGDWHRGRATLRIRDEVDKARFGRELPLSAKARAILRRVAPEAGPIFGGPHAFTRQLRKAARAAGLAEDKAARVTPYDLRHARLTHLAEGGNLLGVAFLAGHKALTTTNRYVHSHQRAAQEVLRLAAAGKRGRRRR